MVCATGMAGRLSRQQMFAAEPCSYVGMRRTLVSRSLFRRSSVSKEGGCRISPGTETSTDRPRSLSVDDTSDCGHPLHAILPGTRVPIAEHMANLGLLPADGFDFGPCHQSPCAGHMSTRRRFRAIDGRGKDLASAARFMAARSRPFANDGGGSPLARSKRHWRSVSGSCRENELNVTGSPVIRRLI